VIGRVEVTGVQQSQAEPNEWDPVHIGHKKAHRYWPEAHAPDGLFGMPYHQEMFDSGTGLVHSRTQLSCWKPLTARWLHVLTQSAIDTTCRDHLTLKTSLFQDKT
jgi:hypothetical protein